MCTCMQIYCTKLLELSAPCLKNATPWLLFAVGLVLTKIGMGV